MKIVFFAGVVGIFSGSNVLAQDFELPRATISGKVIDKASNHPVEYANVLLLHLPDSVVAHGTVSDASGNFLLENVKIGGYVMRVQFVGYNAYTSSLLRVVPGKSNVALGVLEIEPLVSQLQEISVTARRNLIESTIDKKIVSVDPSIVSTGGTALDVIKNVPSLAVDNDGNVSLRGSDNVTVLVDGRPSSYASLDQVPAAIIDHVEVVTNPSAKFQASGMSGIVNIITKKKTGSGLNGMVTANAGTGDRYNGNLNIHYGIKKTNLYIVLDGRTMAAKLNEYQMTERGDQLSYRQEQNTDTRRRGRIGSVKCGVDHSLNENNIVSLSVLLMGKKFITTQYTRSMMAISRVAGNLASTDTSSGNNEMFQSSYVPSLQYKHLFAKKDHELTIDARTQLDDPAVNSSMYIKQGVEQYQKSSATTKDYELLSNYVLPVSGKGKLEAGNVVLYSLVTSKKQTTYQRLFSLDSYFERTRILFFAYGAYTQYSHKIGRFQVQAGLRYEGRSSTIEGTLYKKTPYTLNELYPSAALLYSPNDTLTMQVSYSKRVNYPDVSMLMPVRVKGGTNNWSQGNPFLKPEFVHAIELGVSSSTNKFSTTNTVFMRITEKTLTRELFYEHDSMLNEDIIVTMVKNGRPYYSYGVEHFHNYTFSRILKHTFSASVFASQFSDTSITSYYSMPTLGWMTKFALVCTPVKSYEASVSFNYNSRLLSVQGGTSRRMSSASSAGVIAPVWQVDIATKKSFLRNKASVSLRLADVFNSSAFHIDSYYKDSHVIVQRKRNSRTLFFGILYKIGGGLKNKKRNGDVSDPDM